MLSPVDPTSDRAFVLTLATSRTHLTAFNPRLSDDEPVVKKLAQKKAASKAEKQPEKKRSVPSPAKRRAPSKIKAEMSSGSSYSGSDSDDEFIVEPKKKVAAKATPRSVTKPPAKKDHVSVLPLCPAMTSPRPRQMHRRLKEWQIRTATMM